MKNLIFALFALVILASCSDDDNNATTNNSSDTTSVPNVVVNEIMPKGSTLANEYGNSEDWVEIYNPTASPITLPANSIYFSDDTTKPSKFLLTKDLTIASKGYLVVFCDDSNRVTTNQVHTNFKLSASGEAFAIYYKLTSGVKLINQITFPAADGTHSYGRISDGIDSLGLLIPTPGESNHQ